MVASLVAAFLTAAIAAACFAGHLYQSERAMAAHMRPPAAALSRSGPMASAIHNASAGTSMPAWPARSGQPASSPAGAPGMIVTAFFAGFSVTTGAAVVLVLCYLLCRMVLDRRRLARWESAWAAVGPRWTSRR